MRILYILQSFPYPPTDGVRRKVLHMVRHFCSLGYHCDIIAFGDAKTIPDSFLETQETLPNLRVLGLYPTRSGLRLYLAQLGKVLRGRPAYIARWETCDFASALQQSIESGRYDLIHVDGLAMAPYLQFCKDIPTVLSVTDAVSLSQFRTAKIKKNLISRFYRYLSWWLTQKQEKFWLPKASAVHVVSETDCRYLRQKFSLANIQFTGLPVAEELEGYVTDNGGVCVESQIPRIVLPGLLSVDSIAQGVERFLHDSYFSLLSEYPNIEVIVIGKNPSRRLKSIIDQTSNVSHIEWVEDFYAELARAWVVVVPDAAGTGIKTRILDAMGLSKPVVGTPFALEGFPVKDGVHCFIRPIGSDFSSAVRELLQDTNLRQKMGKAARELVFENFAPQIVGENWEQLYQKAIIQL